MRSLHSRDSKRGMGFFTKCKKGIDVKERFTVRVKAKDGEQAFMIAGGKYGKTGWKLVEDTIDFQKEMFEKKLKRVRVNGGLYADKIAEYSEKLRQIASNEVKVSQGKMSASEAVVDAMLAHGSDGRIDSAHNCGVIADGDHWIVFGFHIG